MRAGEQLKVAIAGGGIGGLTTALGLLKAGFDVTLYERTGQFARFGGPIQFASNALSTLKALDERTFERVMEKFTFTGTRRCGIKDGLRADGSFLAPAENCERAGNPKCKWYTSGQQIFIKYAPPPRAQRSHRQRPA